MTKPAKRRKCEYTHCIAAEINDKRSYIVKGVVFILGYVIIIKSSSAFNFASIILLLVPAFVDNYRPLIKAFGIKPLLWIDRLVKTCNLIVILFCVCGLIGFIIDKGTSFEIINTSLIGKGFSVNKSWVACAMLINLFQTIIMGVFVPNKFDAVVLESNKKKVA